MSTPSTVFTSRRRESVSRTALKGDNATREAQQALVNKVMLLIDRFFKELGYAPRFRVRTWRVEDPLETEIILSYESLDFQDTFRTYLNTHGDPTWRLREIWTTVPSESVLSRHEELHTLAVVVPAGAVRQSWRAVFKGLIWRGGLVLICIYVLFILFG